MTCNANIEITTKADRDFFDFTITNKDTGKTATQRFVWVPSGSFLMGSADDDERAYEDEKPQHQVTLEGFWMADTTCTQDFWEAAGFTNRSYFKGDDRPVENVSWLDVQEFISELNKQSPDIQFALPSEAQWEYACRAGTTTAYSFGDEITAEQANFSGPGSYSGTKPVKAYPPNQWGLYQMHGNVWEWCQDDWHPNYEGAPTDGSAWMDDAK